MVTQWRNTVIVRFLRTPRVGACIMTSLLTSSPRRQPQRGARNSNNIEVMVAAKRSIFSTAGLSQLLGYRSYWGRRAKETRGSGGGGRPQDVAKAYFSPMKNASHSSVQLWFKPPLSSTWPARQGNSTNQTLATSPGRAIAWRRCHTSLHLRAALQSAAARY